MKIDDIPLLPGDPLLNKTEMYLMRVKRSNLIEDQSDSRSVHVTYLVLAFVTAVFISAALGTALAMVATQ